MLLDVKTERGRVPSQWLALIVALIVLLPLIGYTYSIEPLYGIAKFTGIQTIAKDGKSDEYLTLRFAENATLHVPAARINLIQKYIGGFHGHPQLSRLGSGV